MSSREEILSNIRSSLADNENSPLVRESRMQVAQKWLDIHPRGIVPDRTLGGRRSSLALFCEKVIASEASVQKVKSSAKVVCAVQNYLRQNNLPQRVRMGRDRRLAAMNWRDQTGMEVTRGPSVGDDLVCVSHADGGVSETGTLVLTSGPNNPSTLNFLAQNHIIIVRKKDIRKSYEGVWKMLRRKFGRGKLSRTVNLITGPSRSADIEQTLILGAHGPLRVHVIVVDDGSK